LEAFYEFLDKKAYNIISKAEVLRLLKQAFPERCFTLDDISTKYKIPIYKINNLNSSNAVETLKTCKSDLGVVLGTRILKRSTFSIPLLGCINLHKGKVPEYRGMPPGFWELYMQEKTAGVTVHFIDDGLDTGDIIGTSEIAINDKDNENTIRAKLDMEGAKLLAKCIDELNSQQVKRIKQQNLNIKSKTTPTIQQRRDLKKREPHRIVELNYGRIIFKTILYLVFYYLGLYKIVRMSRKLFKKSRAGILLYHRISDYPADPLTTNITNFAEHLLTLKKYYTIRSTSWLINKLQIKNYIPPDSVLIHFDDTYKNVFTHATPLLQAVNIPATFFIATGFIDNNLEFSHDIEKSPFKYENLTKSDIMNIDKKGFEIGCHTVHHVNLARMAVKDIKYEIQDSKNTLENILNKPISTMSFPFGRFTDINEEARQIIRYSGFLALFSAYGGFVKRDTDLFDIPRIGASSEHRPLDILMELEGLSVRDFMDKINRVKKVLGL